MSTKKILMAMLLTLLCISYCNSTNCNTINLSIDDLLVLVENYNKDVRVAHQAIDIAQQGEQVARAARLPEIDASLDLNYLGDATILDREFSNPTKADMPHFGNTFITTVYQPIYTGGAINGGIKLAEAQTKISKIGYDRVVSYTRMTVIENYLNLFKNYNLLKVYNDNIALTERLIEHMKVKGAQGIVLKNDITRYELRLSTLTYDRTVIENNIKVLNYNLTSHLGFDDSTVIMPDSSIINMELPLSSISEWKALSELNSVELRQIKAEQEIAQQNDKIIKAKRLPSIGIIAGNKFEGPITIEIPPINKNLNYWWVGVNISYNISSLFKNNKEVIKSSLNINRISSRYDAEYDNLNRTIEQAYTSYIQAFELLKTQEKNVELAIENYRIVNRRFENQLALLTDMLDASTAKLDADVRLVNARISTIYYYYQLKFISGTL